MKNNILIFSIIFVSLIACSNEENKDNSYQKNVVGTWQLIEVNIGNGSSASNWTSIENGYEYTFNKDGTFHSNRFEQCLEGKYTLSSNLLTIEYNCNDFSTGIESPDGTFIENFKIENGFMFLSPTYMSCDEGCENKFKKIVDK